MKKSHLKQGEAFVVIFSILVYNCLVTLDLVRSVCF